MADIDLKAATPDTTLPTTGFLFGADSQAASAPSVYSTQTVATTLLGSTSLTGATITASAPVLDMSQTWNNSGVTFTGLRFNATDTASAAASLLMDLQLGGSSILNVRKDGTLAFSTSAGIRVQSGSTLNFYTSSVGHTSPSFVLTSNGVRLRDNAGSYFIGGSDDVIFGRRAAANLRLGAADAAAPVAQTLSVQSVVAGTTNTAGANLTITGSQGTGTGAGGSIIFQVAPAGSSGTAQNALATAFQVNGNGGVTGQDGATANTLALRNGTNAQRFNVYNTWTSATNYEAFKIDWITTANTVLVGTEKGSGGGTARNLEFQFDSTTQITLKSGETMIGAGGSPLITLGHTSASASARIGFFGGVQFMNSTLGGVSALRVTNGATTDVGGIQFGGTTSSFPALKRSSASLIVRLADDSADAGLQCAALTVTGNLTISTKNIVTDNTTGTKIGTATTQKIGFFNNTPVVQPTAVADATDNATAITQLNALLSRMRDLGLIAT